MASTQKYQATHSKDINGLSYKSSPNTYANELIVKSTDTLARYEGSKIRDPNRTERGTDT